MASSKKSNPSDNSQRDAQKFFVLLGLGLGAKLSGLCKLMGISRTTAYSFKRGDELYAQCLEAASTGAKKETDFVKIDGLSPELALLRRDHPNVFERWRLEMVESYSTDAPTHVDGVQDDFISDRAHRIIHELKEVRRRRLLTEMADMEKYDDAVAIALTTAQINQQIMRKAIASLGSLFTNGRCTDTYTVQETYTFDNEGQEVLAGRIVKKSHQSTDPGIGDIERAIGKLGPTLQGLTALAASGVIPEHVMLELYKAMKSFEENAAVETAQFNQIKGLVDEHGQDEVVALLKQTLEERSQPAATETISVEGQPTSVEIIDDNQTGE